MSEVTIQQQAALPAVSNETDMIMQLIQQIALNPDIPVEKMQAVINMKMQVFDKNAEIEFNKAMILAQQEMEPIAKTAFNTQTNSAYAKFENILKQCKPVWIKHGFALQFGTTDCPIESHYRVTCEVSHAAGFNKKYQSDLPIDDEGIKGSKNKTGCHGFGSTMAYAQRYLTVMIFNLTLAGADNDGNKKQASQESTFISASQTVMLINALPMAGLTQEQFCQNKTVNIQSIEMLPVERFEGAMKFLQARATK